MPRPTVTALLDAVSQELRRGQIYEAPIIGSDTHVEGLCNWETQEVTVNPAPNVVDTLIHELLHRRFPKWSEERVRHETWRVMKQMTPADVAIWYRKYKRLAKRKTKPVRLRSAEL
jgi:ethanolamine ammonia-lyase small subunit